MSFFDRIQTWWTFKQNAGRRGAKRVYLLDGLGFSSGRRGSPRPGPASQVQLLQRLARFAKKEQVRLVVVLDGKPLREVGKDHAYQGLEVYFADRKNSVSDTVVKQLKDAKRRNAVTVVTSDRKLEERALVNGATCMRASTFKKALDSVSGGSRDGRGSSDPRRRSRRRRSGGNGGDRRDGAKREEKPAKNAGDTHVRELIDLVE